MSELKSYTIYEGNVGNYTEHVVYSKSEADAVITELNDKLQYVSELLKQTRECLIESQKLHKKCADNAVKVIRHNKYKRCLAMAEWCEATALWSYQAANTLPVGFHATLYGKPVMIEPGRLFKRYVLLTKWHKRWLKIAEKFKEEKKILELVEKSNTLYKEIK